MRLTIKLLIGFALISIMLAGCTNSNEMREGLQMEKLANEKMDLDSGNYSIAIFAGGCFWCMESGFEDQPGVAEVISGYSGGTVPNPSYEQVSSGTTGHYESVKVYYDPSLVNYSQLLESFWILIDPTDAGGQFADRGQQYTTVIFYSNEEQKKLAEESMLEVAKRYNKPIATRILPETTFYPAEEYHQDYSKKQQLKYKYYSTTSGRASNIEKNKQNLEKMKVEELKTKLTPLQYKVTQEEGTEPAYNNEYWDNHEDGIYVDIVSGEPLFSSTDKYDSGTGWPSFTKPIAADVLIEKDDYKLGMKRTEVRSKIANSHLGHVFDEDDRSVMRLRYCINSAALRFIPAVDLEKEGYGIYASLFI